MKRKMFRGILILYIMAAMCISVFAATIAYNSYYTAFSSRSLTKNKSVNIVQEYATTSSDDNAAVRWVLYNNDANISADSVWLYGDDYGEVTAVASANHRLRAYNGESSAISFDFSLS